MILHRCLKLLFIPALSDPHRPFHASRETSMRPWHLKPTILRVGALFLSAAAFPDDVAGMPGGLLISRPDNNLIASPVRRQLIYACVLAVMTARREGLHAQRQREKMNVYHPTPDPYAP